ncbi:MAG: NAD(+) diphosphatase [Rhodanobacteraceae bacterium]|nr:MAG: NAD(+) diphosphatase [Rhodanobacteraceae bacterium]
MSSAERTQHNLFATASVDRCGEHRADPAWLAAQRAKAGARWLQFSADGRACVRAGHLAWLDAAAVATDAPANFLGLRAGVPLFALRAAAPPVAAPGVRWLGLREAAMVLDGVDAGLFAYARSLANWQDATRYCAYCGAPLRLVDGGHRALCDACGRMQFPRTDAAIIVIVEHGDACLMGRQASWQAGHYSTLAGFVEPGESLADAVRREVHEETGVDVLDCDYHSSQPWPFPASLMLGFTATAAGRAITLMDGELEAARWFTPDDIARGLVDGSLRLSSPMSISYRLLQHWLRTRAGVDLDALPRGS